MAETKITSLQVAEVSGSQLKLDDLRRLVDQTDEWDGNIPIYPSTTTQGQRDEYVISKIQIRNEVIG